MSIFQSPIYRDDVLQTIARYLSREFLVSEHALKLCHFVIDDPGKYQSIPGLRKGYLDEQIRSGEVKLEDLLEKPTLRNAPYSPLEKLLRRIDTWQTGLPAVFHIFRKVYARIYEQGQKELKSPEFLKNILICGLLSSNQSPRSVKHNIDVVLPFLHSIIDPVERAIKNMYSIVSLSRNRHYRQDLTYAEDDETEIPLLELNDRSFFSDFDVYVYRNVLLLVDASSEKGYVLLRHDLLRIERLLRGFGFQKYFCATYCNKKFSRNIPLYEACLAFQRELLIRLTTVDQESAQVFCRALDVLYFLVLAKFSQDVSDRSYKLQLAKISDEKLDKILNYDKLMAIIQPLKLAEALEIVNLYRSFPQPDYDYFGALNRQEKLWSIKHPMLISEDETETYDEILLYYQYILLRAYHRRHHICPGIVKNEHINENDWTASYPNVNPKRIPFREVYKIDMDGCFQYIEHTTDILGFVKDKSITPRGIRSMQDQSDVSKLDRSEKNMLLDFLKTEYNLNSKQQPFLDIKSEDKAEAKKPNGRMFFELHTHARLLLSEYEDNIAEYAKYAPGCIAGKSRREYLHEVQSVGQPPKHFNFTLPEGVTLPKFRNFIVSFDLDKWSPKLNPKIHDDLDAINSRLFGSNRISICNRIFKEGKVHYIRRRIHQTMDKIPSDYEGMAGKKLTLYHVAVMGYSVRRIRELKVSEFPAKFLALIDDGLLKVYLDDRNYKQDAEKVLDIIERIYGVAGLKISWDKTFVSANLSLFLHELRWQGRIVQSCSKVLSKFQYREDTSCPTIMGDLAIIETSTRALISNGMQNCVAYALYCYFTTIAVEKYGGLRYHLKEKLHPSSFVYAFTPHELGGLGIRSCLELTGSISPSTLESCIGNLRLICLSNKKLAPMVNNILNKPLDNTSYHIANDGTTAFKHVDKVFTRYRLRNALTRILQVYLRGTANKTLKRIFDRYDSKGVDHSFLLSHKVSIISGVLSAKAFPDVILQQIATKFLRSSSLIHFVNRRQIGRIRAANRTESKQIIGLWLS